MIKECKIIRRVCAWCNRDLDGLGPLQDGEWVSHGICVECRESALVGGNPEPVREEVELVWLSREEVFEVGHD